jgi:hypothetical protein
MMTAQMIMTAALGGAATPALIAVLSPLPGRPAAPPNRLARASLGT